MTLCAACSTLAFMVANKNCIKCQGIISTNIAVLCEFCSKTEQQCAVCLKKIVAYNTMRKGCGCGGNK